MESGIRPLIYNLPPEVAARCLSYLDEGGLRAVELTGRSFLRCVQGGDVWRRVFEAAAGCEGWCVPEDAPGVGWKLYLSRYQKEVKVKAKVKVEGAAVGCCWRVAAGGGGRRKSRVFPFAKDALGGDILWQMELETHDGNGQLRVWTTNPWTHQTTCHYFGSHCTVALRNQHNEKDITKEAFVDIDGGVPFTFKIPPQDREIVLRINLTLALEMNSPLYPFYPLISLNNTTDADVVKIGYCKSIFEIAKFKRKHTATFVNVLDREILPLVDVILSEGTSDVLRIEVYQALFNMLGPGCVLLQDGVVEKLLLGCESHLKVVEGQEEGYAMQLTQNVLGNIFNLLIHPAARKIFSEKTACRVTRILRTPRFSTCHFSSLVVLLTMQSWNALPPSLFPSLINSLASFMESVDPLNFEMTGVAWDETDIASYFIPLLRSGDRFCVAFVSWCLGHFYFSASG